MGYQRSMTYQRISVAPIAGALGAEISGVDLATLDDATFADIHKALLDHNVVFFRDQDITPAQQLAFAKRFGEIHHHPFMKGMPDYPDVLEIVKEEGDKRNFGGTWHTDQMFSPQPAMATMLYAHEVPSAGGDTIYTNLYLAYETLSDGMKAMLSEVKTYNIGSRTRQQAYSTSAAMQAKVRDPGNVITESAHPLVRTHPETGRKALYIGGHTKYFDGMTVEESAPLLEYLMAHARRPEFTCRFRWAPGSLALWDNRCCQHFAVNDYHGKRRRMHRITVAGDTPF